MGNRIFSAFLSALLLTLSFPRFDLGFLAWIALIPLLIAIKGQSLKSASGLSFLTGVGFIMGIFYWINVPSGVKWLDFLLMVFYLSLYFGIFGFAYHLISKHSNFSAVLTAPLIWVCLEYLRSHFLFLALPWGLLGHSQYRYLPIIQMAAFTGVYGVSFLIVMVNVALSEVILAWISTWQGGTLEVTRSTLVRHASIPLCLFGIALAYGFSALSQKPAGDTMRVSVVQGNIAQEIKWKPEFRKQILGKYVTLTQNASTNGRAPLIVWPESAVPGPLEHNYLLLKTINSLAKETNTHLLVGSAQRPKFGSREFRAKHRFNGAYLISPTKGIEQRYQKIHLLPFAEYLPYREVFPWPERFVAKASYYLPGKEYTIFDLQGAQFGVLICWESIFSELFRQFVKQGAHFMINIGNEAWFGDTAAPYQFVSMNVFRAVENRITLVRSTNTGVSCFIDPYGRIMGKVQSDKKDIFVDGYLTKEIKLSEKRTFYTKYGDIFAFVNILGLFAVINTSTFNFVKGYSKNFPE